MWENICRCVPILIPCSKCQQYSPTESNTKAYDKAPTRKQGVLFNPEFIIDMLKAENSKKKVIRSKEECLTIYFQVKSLYLLYLYISCYFCVV